MAAELGARPVLCSFCGGESGALLEGLLSRLDVELRLIATATSSGCYVTDRRSGQRELLTCTLSDPPSRHELDGLFSIACAEGIAAGWLAVTNPMPGEALPLELYGDLITDARAGGCRTLVDLSSPRLDSALRGRPDTRQAERLGARRICARPGERATAGCAPQPSGCSRRAPARSW